MQRAHIPKKNICGGGGGGGGVIIWINLVEVHKVMLHIKYQDSKPCALLGDTTNQISRL